MKIMQCLVADDEPNAGKLLEDYIGRVPYLRLQGVCFNGMEVMQQLKEASADLLFLDINMPKLSGMELLRLLPRGQRVILTTAYSEFALESYDYSAVDYLLKPVAFLRFLMAAEKAYGLFGGASTLDPPGMGEFGENELFIKSDKQLIRVDLREIHYFEAMKEYIALHTADRKILMYRRMKDLAPKLPPYFIRIHNSYIVNARRIEKIEGNQVIIRTGLALPLGALYRDGFQQFIRDHAL